MKIDLVYLWVNGNDPVWKERKAKREQVIMLADTLKVDREELLALWLADQVTTVLSSEKPIANKALSIVSKHISEIR